MITKRNKAMFADKDFDMALDKLYNDSYTKYGIDCVYPFTNENMRGIFRHLLVKGKKVATVGSSGDQLLNAVYYGAKEVTLIDGNEFAIPFVMLKIAGIKNLSLEEFNQYMTAENILSSEFYSKISHDIDPEYRMFWDDIMLNGANTLEYRMKLFNTSFQFYSGRRRGGSIPCSVLSEMYENESTYSELREKLRECKLNFILADLSDFPQELQDGYDVILLSNVADYIYEPMSHRKIGSRFFDVVKELEQNCLNPGGRMQVHYEFDEYNEIAMQKCNSMLRDSKLVHQPVQYTRNIWWQTRGTDEENAIQKAINERDCYYSPTLDRLQKSLGMDVRLARTIFLDKPMEQEK